MSLSFFGRTPKVQAKVAGQFKVPELPQMIISSVITENFTEKNCEVTDQPKQSSRRTS